MVAVASELAPVLSNDRVAYLGASPDGGARRRLSPRQRRNTRLRKAACVAADFVAFIVADVITLAIFGAVSSHQTPRYLPVIIPAFAVLRLATLAAQGLYNSRNVAHHVEEGRRLVLASLSAASLMIAGEFVFQYVLPRGLAAIALVTMFVVLLIEREFVRFLFRRARRAGRCLRPVVVVGCGDGMIDAVHTIQNEPWSGAKVLGYYAPEPCAAFDAHDFPHGYLGQPADVIAGELPSGCTGVIIDPEVSSGDEVDLMCRTLNYAGFHLEVLAPIRGIAPERLQAIPLGRMTTIRVGRPGNTHLRAMCKRLVDIVGSLAGIVLLAPVWAACAIATALDDGLPFVFRQSRAGLGGKPFGCFKIRTMVKDAEAIRDQMRRDRDEGLLFKLENDPRITRVGRLLRKTSLDETLQLFNVLKGEMSLVGPRPLPTKDLLGKCDERVADRLRVRPGMTGMWQVSGRSDIADDDFLKLDLHYVDNWSLFVDLMIIAKTIPAVIWAKGAR